MSDSFVQQIPDSTGKRVDCSVLTVGAVSVYRQRLSLGSDTDPAAFASVIMDGVVGGLVTVGSAADGSALKGYPVRVGGTDGTNIRTIATDTAGRVKLEALAAPATMADGMTNPSVSNVATEGMVYNGSTWDRVRSNYNTPITADLGTKTASFNGALQTNFNAAGATIAIAVSSISGVLTTLSVKVQGTDDGTNFWDVPTAGFGSATAVAAGVYVMQIHPSLTPALNTTNPMVSALLPRQWRLVYTLGGVAPSVTISRIGVCYSG